MKRREVFSLRRYKVGLVSVIIGLSFFGMVAGGSRVYALSDDEPKVDTIVESSSDSFVEKGRESDKLSGEDTTTFSTSSASEEEDIATKEVLESQSLPVVSDRAAISDRSSTETLPEGQPVFTKGQYKGVGAFRIPVLLKTVDGTVIAGADQRNAGVGDYGDIDMVVRRSTDDGQSWGEKIPVFNIKNNPQVGKSDQPTTMDMAMVQDPHDKTIYAFYDLFPEGRGMGSLPATAEKSYQTISGNRYQILYKGSEVYTIRENGQVYDPKGQKTAYRVVTTPQDKTHKYEDYGNLYEGSKLLGNVYFKTKTTSPFRVAYTSYIMVSESKDDGKTWSAPRNISDMVRTDDMEFQGIGPGTGIVLKQGQHAGRIIIPTYTRNGDGKRKQESTRIIYSDDHGKTWKSSGIVYGRSQNSEASVVELRNGQLKLFMRNSTGKMHMATSRDGGVTWGNSIEVISSVPELRTQLSAITTMQDGKEYVLLSNAGPERRVTGNIHVAQVQSDGSLKWIAHRVIQSGIYGYSSLQDLGNGRFGVLFEHGGSAPYPQEIYYKTFAWSDLIQK